MKYGAVCSPPGDFGRKVDILRRMAPQTVRVSLFWQNASTPQFSNDQLDQLLGTPDINMKVTEAAINSNDPNRPPQYVEFAEKVATPRTDTKGGGGNLDSVCFYGLPLVEGYYNIDEVAADAIGSRVQSNYCG